MSSVEILSPIGSCFGAWFDPWLNLNRTIIICGEAGHGIEAIEKVRQLRSDIVLMDINTPRTDGLEATRVIRREVPECNVIIVTQNDATVAREQARTANAKRFVAKSNLTRDLIPTIEKFRSAKPEVNEANTAWAESSNGEE
jgi:two-component system response regulator DegU